MESAAQRLLRPIWTLTILVVTAILLPPPALAEPPSRQDIREAKKHYSKAKRAIRKKDFLTAVVHLKDAENKHPDYKYASALASAHLQAMQPVLAWEALLRSERYGIPEKKQAKFDELYAAIEKRLLEKNAYLELTVFPANASVRIAKQQWLPPFQKWVPRSFSVLELEAPGYKSMSVKWHHPTGYKATRVIKMEPVTNFGRVEVTGQPAGARVTMDGRQLGTLPRARSGLLSPGEYTVKIEKNEFVTVERTVVIKKNAVATVDIVLEPTESESMKALKSKKVWGWTTVGVGGAALVTGIALLAHSAVLVDEVNELNRTHVSGYQNYLSEYDQKSKDIPTFSGAGWAMVAVGIALGATGTTLLILEYGGDGGDSADGEFDTKRNPTVQIAPSPMGASATVRF